MAALDQKELQNELKKKRICRFCLSMDPLSLTNIFFRDSLIKSSVPLTIQVMAIASMEIFNNDGMPPYACSDCISMFEYSYQFKQMCKKADNLLRQYPLVGIWPKRLEKPTMPKALLTKFLQERNNKPLQEDVKKTKNVTQVSLLLPKKIQNIDAEGGGKAKNNVTNSQQCVPKVEKEDDECSITHWEKIDNSNESSMNDVQLLVDSKEVEPIGTENLSVVLKQKILNKSSVRILNKVASPENEPRLSLPKIKKCEDGNMEIVAEILNTDDKHEDEPNPKNAEPVERNNFPCPHCERSFPLAQLRNLHLKVQHLRDSYFPCSKCNMSFFNKQSLEKHLFSHNAEKPIKYSDCDRGFNQASNSEQHLKNQPKHTCDHCGMSFIFKEDMDKHVKRHNQNRPFKCKMCDKSFVFKQGLESHEVMHSNLQPFPCQYGDQSFPTAHELTRHLIVHRPFPCKYCKKSYLQSKHLTRHLRSHRNINNVDFICPTCKTSFKTRDQLIQHSKTHASEQNLTCPLCNDTLKNIKTLTTHVQDHSEGEAYACEFCDLIFMTEEKLQLHSNLDHAQEMELYHAGDRAQADKKKEIYIKDAIDLTEESLQSTDNAFLMGELSDSGRNQNNQLKRKIKSEQETSPKIIKQIIIQNETEQTKNDKIENHPDDIDLSEESLQSTVNAFLMGELSDGGENFNNQLERKIKTEQESPPKIMNQIIIQNESKQTKINGIGYQVNGNVSLLKPLEQRKINATKGKFITLQEKKEQQNKQLSQLKHEVVNTATPTRHVNKLTRQSLLKIPEKTSSSTKQKTLLDKVKEDASPSPSSTNPVENRSGVKTVEKKVKVQKIKVTRAEAAAMVRDGHVKIKDGKIILKRKSAKTIVSSDDGMPSYICFECISLFEYSYQFKQMCEKADKLLRQYPIVGIWPNSLEKPNIPQTLLIMSMDKQNNRTAQEHVQQSNQYVTQEFLRLPKKILNVDAESNGNTYNNVTNCKQCVPKVEKLDGDYSSTYLKKIDNSEELSTDDIKLLVASEDVSDVESLKADNVGSEITKSKIIKEAVNNNEHLLNLSKKKKNVVGNMEIVYDIFDLNNKCEKEPDSKNVKEIETNIFPCPNCERTFSLVQLRDLHLNSHIRDRNFQCDECDKSFITKKGLQEHLYVHNGEKPFKCLACDKTFSRLTLLTRHEKKHPDIPKYVCVHCGRAFISKQDMQRHTERHNKNRPFHCKVCNKSFVFKQGLERHNIVHSSQQPFPCQYCNQNFSTTTKLARHLKYHAGLRPYPCKIWKKSFLLAHHLTRHLRSHKNINNTMNVVNFLCSICKISFDSRDKLIQHSKTHANEQNLVCPLCNETFDNTYKLTTHIQDHSEGEAYACEFCDLIFITAKKLQLHTNVVHTQEMEVYNANYRVQADIKKESTK